MLTKLKTQQSAKYYKPLSYLSFASWSVLFLFLNVFQQFQFICGTSSWWFALFITPMSTFFLFFSPLELNRIMVEWLNKVHSMHSDHSKLWQPQEMLILREINKSFCFAKIFSKFLEGHSDRRPCCSIAVLRLIYVRYIYIYMWEVFSMKG